MSGRPLVTAALIVKDEEACLGRCLGSIAAWCDDLLVVDTGSTDATVAIAESFGARVLHHPWDGDFAAARNHGLDHASGEWILYIDADEVIEPVTPEVAAAELRSNLDAVCLRVWFQDRPGFTPYREFRLWRNRADIRFVGRMHETPVPDLERIADAEGGAIRDTDVFRFRHDGYEGDQTAKHLRNLPLLQARLEELPYRVYLWNHLGNVHAALGDRDAALAAWQAGVDVVRRFGLAERTDVLAYAGLGLELIDRGHDISTLCDELEALAPWYRTTMWLRVQDLRGRGRWAEAIPLIEVLLEQSTDEPDPHLSYNVSMFTDWAWAALGDCQLQLGRLDRAAEAYAEAARLRPDRLEYRTKSGGLRALARQQETRAREV